ncbi:hypothetical protein B0H21DRAFT_710966 [Amylocystis lapponica]|nr:hypothetical protein B0H21DRAFT_710966 [Amylocystis lapponica]
MADSTTMDIPEVTRQYTRATPRIALAPYPMASLSAPEVVQQPYTQTYMQYQQPQPQYTMQVHNPPQPFQHFMPVQAPQMVFPQPQMNVQPVIPSMPMQSAQNVMAGVIYPPQNVQMAMPQPQTQYQAAPVIPSGPAQNTNAPVIPQMSSIPQHQQQPQMSMPEPITFPEPQISSRNPSPSHLAPGQYGQYDARPRTPLHNPLPAPPKDVFEMSPYMTVLQDLRRPIEDTSLKRTYSMPSSGGSHTAYPSRRTSTRPASRQKRHKKGLFGSIGNVFNPRRYEDDEDEYDSPGMPSAQLFGATYAGEPTLQRMPDGSSAFVYNIPPQARTQSAPTIPGRGRTPAPTPREILKIDRFGGLASLLHHSPYSVHYANRQWPSALHLLEGLKFLDAHPDIAEDIRHASTEEVTQISTDEQRYVRPDWEQVVRHLADDVLYQKFIQHPQVRALLMGTGTADLIYSTSHDPFWGDGTLGQGANELGQALVRVRERLRTEGY